MRTHCEPCCHQTCCNHYLYHLYVYMLHIQWDIFFLKKGKEEERKGGKVFQCHLWTVTINQVGYLRDKHRVYTKFGLSYILKIYDASVCVSVGDSLQPTKLWSHFHWHIWNTSSSCLPDHTFTVHSCHTSTGISETLSTIAWSRCVVATHLSEPTF